MGPSGSGKTTLLHALSGIIKLDAGSVLFNGPTGQVAVESLSERERTSLRANSFGFVFQQGLLVPELTAGGERLPRRDDCRCSPPAGAFHFG